jgi:hypothetical protein
MLEMQFDPGSNNLILEFFRSYLQQVVTIHHAMFEKLLFQSDDVPVELAELFEDAGNVYLDISEQISRRRLEEEGSQEEAS